MQPRRILFTWIGHTDLRAMAASLPADQQREVLEGLNPSTPLEGQSGPLKCLVDQEAFDEVHLLTNYSNAKNEQFVRWLGGNPILHPVRLDSPIDHAEIFQVVDAELAGVVPAPRNDRCELYFHLSPGTPAMAAIWLLLGKSRYHPVTFFQTHDRKAWVTEVPFDLVVDYVPQVLRHADAQLQSLASESPQNVRGFEEIAGESHAIRVAVGRARRAARRDVSILLLGESGVGKELFARAVHDASPRRDKPFIPINCAALSKELLESELFGHKKGAFTGAVTDRAGAFELADGGTLFLDEVGECDPAVQAKLLRVLQPPDDDPCHRDFNRLGETKTRSANVRVIAATNRDLVNEAAENRFRVDLYYRLAVITIKLPALRERRQDLPHIVEALLERINRTFEKKEPGYVHKRVSSSAMEFVRKHSWPGNVRQLFNTLVQAAVMTDGELIERHDLVDAIADVSGKPTVDLLELPLGDGFSLQRHLEDIQRHYLERAMREAAGVKKRAAELLGYRNYQTLAAQLDRLAIEISSR